MRLQDTDQYRHLVVYLRAEHQHLHEVLRSIETAFAERDKSRAPDSAPSLLDGLANLREELQRHFSVEEEGGCIEEAVCRCPSLSPEATRLEHQHPVLLGSLDSIIERLRSSSQREHDIGETSRQFKQLVKTLHAHEAAEDRIMQRAFGGQFELRNNEC